MKTVHPEVADNLTEEMLQKLDIISGKDMKSLIDSIKESVSDLDKYM